MTCRLKMAAYCGMTRTLWEGSLADCRYRAYRAIRRHRNVMEYPVTVLKRGQKWELETGENACMVGDGEGILKIVRVKRGR